MDTSNRQTNPSDEATEEQIAAAEQTIGQTKEKVAEIGQQIQSGVATATEATQEMLKAAGEQLAGCARATDQAIRKHPYQALGIALGAGILCGFLLKRK